MVRETFPSTTNWAVVKGLGGVTGSKLTTCLAAAEQAGPPLAVSSVLDWLRDMTTITAIAIAPAISPIMIFHKVPTPVCDR